MAKNRIKKTQKSKIKFDIMLCLSRAKFLSFFFAAVFFAQTVAAFPSFKKNQESALPTVMKADEVSGDRISNVLTAEGNVEVSKGTSVVYADKMVYNKDGGTIRAIGNVRVKDLEIGNVKAGSAEIKDDFSSGLFTDSRIFFTDGSYLFSEQIERKTPLITILERPIFSVCPNPDISKNNDLAGQKRDFFSIKSRRTTIDRENQVMKMNHGIMRFYNVPLLYTPYFQTALPEKGRQSGFLFPSYVKSSNLGLGIKTPFYWNIAPNKDLTVTPFLGVSSGVIVLNNDFRHMTSYGEYRANLEIANNKITSTNDSTVVVRTDAQYRGHFAGKGIFDFTKNSGLDFDIDTVSDRNYLRDYYFNYQSFTLSKVNLDYIKGRSYHSIKTIRVQELESTANEDSAPLIFPVLDSYIETKPLFFKEKFALTSNMAVISRQDGLQYRRATVVPEVNVPFNLRGNLFNVNAKFQGDAYWLENNFKATSPTNNYDSAQTNYKPELSLSWKLPLLKKSKFNTILIEPMANIVSSSYGKNFNKMPNEDSNNSELSVSNLFVADRIAGFDRNEAGQRVSYGVKSSLFNEYGEFGLTIGQSYRKGGGVEDVTIKGFNSNNKSNIVGQAMYKTAKIFSLIYSFQLNESNYSNDVNQLTTIFNFDRVIFSSDYLLIRKTTQNATEKEQINFSSTIKLNTAWKAIVSATKDLTAKRLISRGVTISRDGCCTIFSFALIETNPSSLTKPQKTFNLSLSFKNL
jgi:LPS-assembly protein